MKTRLSVFNPSWKQAIAERVSKSLAKWAGYNAAKPSRTFESRGRYGTNPNSSTAQIERVAMIWGAEHLGKNSEFGIGYLKTRRNYCSAKLTYAADTGDDKLNEDVNSYLAEAFKLGGCNQPMQSEFAQTFDAEMAVRGDAALLWDRNEDGSLFFRSIRADQIGEIYSFVNPYTKTDGLRYLSGMYFRGAKRVGFKIYENDTGDQYTNPQNYDAADVIYGQDNLMPGIRGITVFHGAIIILEKSDSLFQSGMDAARRQAKTAVVVFNEQGAPGNEMTYKTTTNYSGDVIYAEKNAEGAVVEYQYTGDDYRVVNTEAPGPELIQGVRYADEKASLALGFPYSFLVNTSAVGGAGNRLEINRASGEIGRIQNTLHRPKLDVISYVMIMNAVERRIFRPRRNITLGEWSMPNLPTADAFKDSKDDIMSLRAGLDTRASILGRYGENEKTVLRRNKQSAIAIAMAVEDANDELEAAGYERTITAADIAQSTDNPVQSASATDQPVSFKPNGANGKTNGAEARFKSDCGANSPGGGGFQSGNVCSREGGATVLTESGR